MSNGSLHFSSYSTLLSLTTPCGQSSDYPGHFECVALKDCTEDITGHLASLKLSTDDSIGTEMKLLLARAGKHFCNSTNIKATCAFTNSFRSRDNLF